MLHLIEPAFGVFDLLHGTQVAGDRLFFFVVSRRALRSFHFVGGLIETVAQIGHLRIAPLTRELLQFAGRLPGLLDHLLLATPASSATGRLVSGSRSLSLLLFDFALHSF